jgi:hypothetical protein
VAGLRHGLDPFGDSEVMIIMRVFTPDEAGSRGLDRLYCPLDDDVRV